MANSSIIGKAKNKVIREFIRDKEIIAAIDSSLVSSKEPEKLVGSHIFSYHQNPNTLNTVETFITIQVHIPASFYRSQIYVSPTIEIWIISHEKHMKVDNVPKVNINRNDYLSQLIDNKLNGKTGYGIGELTLLSNEEGSYQQDYVYRKMVFEGKDLNDSLCEEE